MKILMLLRGPLDNDSRVKKEIQSLTKFGHEVSIVSVNTINANQKHNYVHKWDAKRRVLPGISAILSFFSFLAFSLNKYKDHRVIHSHDLNTLPIGCIIKLLSFGKAKLIYDTHEFASNDTPYESILRQKIKSLIESIFIKFADEIITVNNAIANLYKNSYKLKKNPFVIHNCPEKIFIPTSNILKEKLGIPSDRYLIIYQGILSRGRNIQQLISFMNNTEIENIAIVFMGYGELEEEVKNAVNKRIFYHPAVPPQELLNYTISADCGITLIEDSCISYRYCTTNKMFEYAMAGLPVITSDLPEQARLVKKYKIGEVSLSNRSVDLTAAILSTMKIQAHELKENIAHFTDKYNWQNQSLELTKVYEEN